jgi:hypothetical protein
MTTAQKTNAKAKSARKPLAGKSSAAQHCWPGFEPTPGKKAGEKGSCKPRKNQTSAMKTADARAAAASKREKAGKA